MLIKTIDEVREVLKVSANIDFAVLKPVLTTVDTKFMRKVLGTGMHDELTEYYDAGAPTTTLPQKAMKALLDVVQVAEVHLAYWYGFDLLNVTIDNNGARRVESDKVKGLYKYQEDNLKEFFKSAGFDTMDSVLELLDGEDKEYYTEFHSSATGIDLKKMFIPRTDVFEQHYFLNGSRLTFNRLRHHMKVVEDLKIKYLIGAENYELIKTEMVKDEPADKVLAILPYIRKPIAYLSTAMLMEETGADLSDKGLIFESITAISNDHSNRQPSTDSRVAKLIKRNTDIGNSYLGELRQYLFMHATDWNNFNNPVPSRVPSRDNTGKKTFFA